MNDEELKDLIIRELGKHHERQDIVAKICERTTLSWGDAERLLDEVQSQNKKKIAARQGPFLLFVSIGSLVLGMGMLAYNFEFLVSIFNQDLLQQVLGIRNGYYRLAALVTGLGMTVGGMYGAWTALASYFPDPQQ